MFVEQIFSSRCILSRLQYDDWPYLLKATCSDKFPSELALSQIITEQAAQEWHRARMTDWNNQKCFVWSIRQYSSSEVIGQVSLFKREHDFALAYWLHPELWKQGIITEVAGELIQSISDSGYQGSLWAGTNTWNKRSFSVLMKLGFEFQQETEYPFDNGCCEKIREYKRVIGK